MSKLRDKLNRLENEKVKIKQNWESIESQQGLSTRDKLEKLVNLSLKREKFQNLQKTGPATSPTGDELSPKKSYYPPSPQVKTTDEPFIVSEFSYPLDSFFGKFPLEEWKNITPRQLEVLFGEDASGIQTPMDLLFFDTETTGLAGGTGTIPFMLGFGFFDMDVFSFRVKIYVLCELNQEGTFLENVDRFLGSRSISGTVTFNGKSFDFPLMESRYILQRKRFPLMRGPHLDFLYPARVLWKHTHDSRKLSYLGEMMLGLSREDDIDPAYIPNLYFNFLRSRHLAVLQKVIEHNALDLVGMAALILLALKYQQDIAFIGDEGEILGLAVLYERYGDLERAGQLYEILKDTAVKEDVMKRAVKGLAVLKKKMKLYEEASGLWELLADSSDHQVIRELSVHFEHRLKNFHRAFEYTRNALETIQLTDSQRADFEKRLARLQKKMASLEKEDQ